MTHSEEQRSISENYAIELEEILDSLYTFRRALRHLVEDHSEFMTPENIENWDAETADTLEKAHDSAAETLRVLDGLVL